MAIAHHLRRRLILSLIMGCQFSSALPEDRTLPPSCAEWQVDGYRIGMGRTEALAVRPYQAGPVRSNNELMYEFAVPMGMTKGYMYLSQDGRLTRWSRTGVGNASAIRDDLQKRLGPPSNRFGPTDEDKGDNALWINTRCNVQIGFTSYPQWAGHWTLYMRLPKDPPRDPVTNKFSYSGATEVKNVHASELYDRAKAWSARTYSSMLDVEQHDDRGVGRLLLKGRVNGGIYSFRHTLTIEVMNSRYQYVMTDFVWYFEYDEGGVVEGASSSATHDAVGSHHSPAPVVPKKVSVKETPIEKIWQADTSSGVLEYVVKISESLVTSLKDAMMKPEKKRSH